MLEASTTLSIQRLPVVASERIDDAKDMPRASYGGNMPNIHIIDALKALYPKGFYSAVISYLEGRIEQEIEMLPQAKTVWTRQPDKGK